MTEPIRLYHLGFVSHARENRAIHRPNNAVLNLATASRMPDRNSLDQTCKSSNFDIDQCKFIGII